MSWKRFVGDFRSIECIECLECIECIEYLDSEHQVTLKNAFGWYIRCVPQQKWRHCIPIAVMCNSREAHEYKTKHDLIYDQYGRYWFVYVFVTSNCQLLWRKIPFSDESSAASVLAQLRKSSLRPQLNKRITWTIFHASGSIWIQKGRVC